MKLIIFILVLITIFFAFGKELAKVPPFNQFLGNNGYKMVDLETLFSYANFHTGQSVCTEGYHIKSKSYDVLKIDLDRDPFSRAALVKYEKDKLYSIDSLLPNRSAAYVKACGEFESERGKILSELGSWNHQITIEEYELLESPKAFSF